MKKAIDLCKCLEKMIIIGKVMPFSEKGFLSYYSDEVEEGTLCLAINQVSDNGYYEGYDYISNFEVETELFPINYCPVCGKQIKYEQVKKLEL